MNTYVILSKLSPDSVHDPSEFPKLAEMVAARIKKECPKVVWKQSFALMGQFDVMDIVEAGSVEEVEKAAMIIRGYGHATTETMPATPWKSFIKAMGKTKHS